MYVLCQFGLVQCITGQRASVGSLVEMEGNWQFSRSRESRLYEKEFIATKPIHILSNPIVHLNEQTSAELARQDAIRLIRGGATQYLLGHIEQLGFIPIDPAIIVGERAALGNSLPFTVTANHENAYLTVSSMINHVQAVMNGIDKTCSLSRLFWAQRYGDRNSLNEITGLEIGIANSNMSDLMDLAEYLIRQFEAVVRINPAYQMYSSARNCLGLFCEQQISPEIPRITHDEYRRLTAHLPGISANARDEAIFDQLSTNVFWLIEKPDDTGPRYVKMSGGKTKSFELRVRGVKNVCAGSEWDTANNNNWVETLQISSTTSPQTRTIDGGGFTLGLDRLLAFLVAEHRVRDVFPETPIYEHLPSVALTEGDKGQAITPNELYAHRPATPRHQIAQTLLERGVLPVFDTLFTWADRSGPTVDFFNRALRLRSDPAAITQLLTPMFPALYEIGPYFLHNGPNWHRHQNVLTIATLDKDPSLLTACFDAVFEHLGLVETYRRQANNLIRPQEIQVSNETPSTNTSFVAWLDLNSLDRLIAQQLNFQRSSDPGLSVAQHPTSN